MKKNPSLTVSPSRQLEGLSILVLSAASLVFLYFSARTLYYFPVPDSYRWYGDETWILIAAKNLLLHGRLIVPTALGSTFQSAPGLLLGSPWIAAVIYGFPQILIPANVDVIDVGRSISFILGLTTMFFIGWSAFRLNIGFAPTALSIVMLMATKSFTFATHSARYDIMAALTLLAFVIFFVISSQKPRISFTHPKGHVVAHCFLLGILAVLTALTISPHMEVLLLLPAIYIAWQAGAFRSWRSLASSLSGALVGLLALVVIYSISNHSFSIWGGIKADNQFGSVLSNLPIRRFFSYSAQSHQLWAKQYYLLHEAPAFAIALPVIFLSEVALLVTKRQHSATGFLTACFFLSILGAVFFQSTLPYYLIHLLPLAALVFAAHLNEWRKFKVTSPILSLANVALAAYIVLMLTPEIDRAGKLSNKIEEANSAAVQAAFELEGSSGNEPDTVHPLVLAQAPAIHELLRDTSLRVMSEAFIFFPEWKESPDSTIARMGVKYIVDYDRPMTPEYETAVHRARPVFSRAGHLLDRNLDYFQDTTSEIDTLTLYEFDSAK